MRQQTTTEFLAEKEELLTVNEAADLLAVEARTIRRWIKSKALPAVSFPEKAGRQKQVQRIRRSVLEAVMNTTFSEWQKHCARHASSRQI